MGEPAGQRTRRGSGHRPRPTRTPQVVAATVSPLTSEALGPETGRGGLGPRAASGVAEEGRLGRVLQGTRCGALRGPLPGARGPRVLGRAVAGDPTSGPHAALTAAARRHLSEGPRNQRALARPRTAGLRRATAPPRCPEEASQKEWGAVVCGGGDSLKGRSRIWAKSGESLPQR